MDYKLVYCDLVYSILKYKTDYGTYGYFVAASQGKDCCQIFGSCKIVLKIRNNKALARFVKIISQINTLYIDEYFINWLALYIYERKIQLSIVRKYYDESKNRFNQLHDGGIVCD